MRGHSEAAWERAMKVQEVILRAMAKRITWWQAAEILGMRERSLRRWQQHGYDGLFDRRRGRPSPRRVAVETVEEVLRLYQERYADFNVRHFHEKLREEHSIRLSYTRVKLALQGAGLVAKGRRRGDGASGGLAPGKDACRRNCVWPGSPPSRKRTPSCGSAAFRR
jgi:transposase